MKMSFLCFGTGIPSMSWRDNKTKRRTGPQSLLLPPLVTGVCMQRRAHILITEEHL